MKNYLIVVAAGKGKRCQTFYPKQYQYLQGIPIIKRTVDLFLQSEKIHKVCVVYPKGYLEITKDCLQHLDNLILVEGGKYRQDSVYQGLLALENDKPDNILIHDAVRPFVTQKLIHDILISLNTNDTAVPVIPIPNTLKKIDQNNCIISTENRKFFVQAQTPQAFKFKEIMQAYQQIKKRQKTYQEFTDDASIYEEVNKKINTIKGDDINIKITTPHDLQLAKVFLQQFITQNAQYLKKQSENIQENYSINNSTENYSINNSITENKILENDITTKKITYSTLGVDVHAYQNTDKQNNTITLGTIEIPSKFNIVAHSDGDLVLHAIIDATLSAICYGDIGDMFPDTDPKWKNYNSQKFLEIVLDILKQQKVEIIYLDVTIICEEPKISRYKNDMKKKLTQILNLDPKQVAVKATTTEKLGFLGKKEGIASLATMTFVRKIKKKHDKIL